MRTPMHLLPLPAVMPDPDTLVVLGIDPSLAHTGYCVLRDGQVVEEGVRETDSSSLRVDRLISQAGWLRGLLADHVTGRAPHALVAMEAEIWTSNPSQGSEQAAIQAMYQTVLRGRMLDGAGPLRARFLSVNVSHVKKYVGAQQKNQILLQVFKKFHREYKDDNIADAFVVGAIGDALYRYHVFGRLWPEATKPQIEVLDKLRETGLVWEVPPVKKTRKKRAPRA